VKRLTGVKEAAAVAGGRRGDGGGRGEWGRGRWGTAPRERERGKGVTK